MLDELLRIRQLEVGGKLELIASRPEKHLRPSDYKKLTFEEAVVIIDSLKKRGKRVVLVSGVFDILHIGHLAFFDKAREYGDVLGVATPTDKQIQENKDPDRPITVLSDRLTTLSCIETVDFTFPQNSWSTTELLKNTLPSAYVYTSWHNKNHMAKFIEDVHNINVQLQQVDLDTSAISSSRLISLIEKLK